MDNSKQFNQFDSVDWYAQRAKLAYADETEIQSQLDNVILVATIESINVLYFIESVVGENKLLISVRGTDNAKNFIEDAEYLKIYSPEVGAHVHRGFYHDAKLIYADIMSRRIIDKDTELLLTGHSLGAAISSLLMAFFRADGYIVGKSINFGQPKFTNSRGAKNLSELPLLRVVDMDDVVPLVPPLSLATLIHGAYTHFGDELILLRGNFYSYVDKSAVKKLTFGQFWKDLFHLSVNEHYIEHYIENILPKLASSVFVPFAERKPYL